MFQSANGLAGILILTALLTAAGCSNPSAPPREIGKVSGSVKLKGQPVEGLVITFIPEGGGQESVGRTDAQGRYELDYGGGGMKGALVGQHRVAFQSVSEQTDPHTGEPVPGGEDLLPPKYATGQVAITREVLPGEQVIDFELD